jgi:serine protease AprX
MKTYSSMFASISKRAVRTRSLFMVLMLSATAAVQAANSKISADLQQLRADQDVAVIVQFRNGAGAGRMKSAAGFKHALRTLPTSNAAAVMANRGEIEQLADNPDVEYISVDRTVRATNLDYAFETANAHLAGTFGSLTGKNIGVALIDSGVFIHRDLIDTAPISSHVVYEQNFVGSHPLDEYGHGTHVAGLLAGNGALSTGSNYTHTFRGIAPNVKIVSLKVLDKNGVGTDSGVIAAIDRAIQLKARYNIRVINLSLGRPVFESYTVDPLCKAVERAWRAGIVVVVAAGNGGRDNSNNNEGYSTITSPANSPYVITVGATRTMFTASRTDDVIASYSSKGPTAIDHIVKPDLVAPGNQVISLLAANTLISNKHAANRIPFSLYTTFFPGMSPFYYRLSGTSMATPMVSGAVALLLEKEPALTPDQVKARLMKTASKQFPLYSSAVDPVTGKTYNTQHDIFTVGAGYLDIAAALASNDVADGLAFSPKAVYDPAANTVSLQFAQFAVWGTSWVWGTSAVWGWNVVLPDSSTLWGSSWVWGTNTNTAFSWVWGTLRPSATVIQTAAESIAVNGDK